MCTNYKSLQRRAHLETLARHRQLRIQQAERQFMRRSSRRLVILSPGESSMKAHANKSYRLALPIRFV